MLQTLRAREKYKEAMSDEHPHKATFKMYDVTTWLTNNYNTHIAQYLTK